MLNFFAKNILLASGWSSNVRMHVDDNGRITNIEPNTAKHNEDILLNGAVIPAISNCHSHAFQRAFAGLTERGSEAQDSFWSWREMMYRFVSLLTPEDCHIIATQAYIEMLKAGYSRVGEFHYLHHEQNGKHYDDHLEMSHQVIQAAQSVGLRMTFLPVMYQYAGFDRQPASQLQQRFLNNLINYQTYVTEVQQYYPDLTVAITPHSLRAVAIEDIQTLVNDFGCRQPFHIHIAEQQAEVEQCLAYSQLRPVEYLFDYLNIQANWTFVHATHLTAGECQSILNSGAVVGICPTTEANLGDGFFPAKLLQDTNLQWAIGSDSHISIDPLEELRTLEYGLRLKKHQRAVLTDAKSGSVGQRLWLSAVSNGNQSLNGNAPHLGVGFDADFLVLNSDHAALLGMPTKYLLDTLIFSAKSGHKIKDVYIGGRQVIENGRHPLEIETARNYQKVISRLLKCE